MKTAFRFGLFELIPSQNILLNNGERCTLNARAFDILVALIERAGEVVSNREIIQRAWPTVVVEEANLRMQIAALRRTLGDCAAEPRYILNVPGRGYRLIVEVTSRELDSAAENPPSRRLEPVRTGPPEPVLPCLITELVGRDKTIEVLADQLLKHRFVTVVGTGGIGKTTLAIATAWRIAHHFKDGVFFVDFGSLPNSDLVVSAVASTLRLETTTAASNDSVLQFLRFKHILLVLDNCEHVIDEAASLAEILLKGAAHVHILTTSHEPLRGEGERLHRLTPLEFPSSAQAPISAETAATYSAIQLFADRATASVDTFKLSNENAPVIAEICRKLDGIPLALELAAARANQFSIATLLHRLERRFEVLSQGRRTAPPRHQALRATLDWSFQILSPLEQDALVRLGIFAASFSLETAVFILASEDFPTSQVERVIESLSAKSLIATEIDEDRTYYRLLETTRIYVLEKLEVDDTFPKLARRLAEYFREVLSNQTAVLEGVTSEQRRAVFGRWIADIRRIFAWAFSSSGDAAIGAALAVVSGPVWLELTFVSEYEHHVYAALECLTHSASSDHRQEMELNTKAGLALFNLIGPGPRYVSAFQRALLLAEQLGDLRCQLTAIWGLYGERHVSGDFEEMLRLAEKFKDVSRRSDDKHAGAMSARLMALALCRQGKLSQSHAYAELSLAGTEKWIDSDLDTAYYYKHGSAALANLACTVWLQGDFSRAMCLLKTASDRAASLGDPITLCYVLSHVACPLALWAGDDALAGRHIELFREHSRRNGFSYFSVWATSYAYVLAKRAGTPMDNSVDGRDADFELWIAENSGQLFPLQREILATVDEDYDDVAAVERASSRSPGWAAAEILRAKGERLLKTSHPNRVSHAEALFGRALEIAREQHSKAWELRAAISQARLWSSAGQTAKAASLLASVRNSFEPSQRSADISNADALLNSLLPN